MCGITGQFNFNYSKPIQENTLQKMTSIISHRGPDDEGIYISKNRKVGLGHRRLSIIDLKSGHQPMSDIYGKVWIVFNGEIYNFPELKKELINKGYKFRTTSDTEVIINFYLEYGEEQFYRLNGIFAFAIYDEKENKLVLARDHFGVKPLYCFYDNEKIIFGSEIKSILASENFEKQIDFSALDSLLTFRYNPSPDTLIKGIKKLKPSHYLVVDSNGKIKEKDYWNYYPITNFNISENEAIKEYQRLLENSVRRQLISDVPVGLLLSGGIDSAVIGYLMQKYSYEKIKTFSIGFEGEGDYNELDDAKKSAEFISSEHYELKITRKEYLDFFLKSFYYTEEPISEPTIPALYYISKLAAENVKVVLSGQGADEPLGGYKRYMGEKILSTFPRVISLFSKLHVGEMLNRNERFKQTLYASVQTNLERRFLSIYTVFNEHVKKKIIKDEYSGLIKNNNVLYVENLFKYTSNLSESLNKLLFIDTRMSLSDDLLIFGDKISMANSLEMRVPFLDVELIKYLESLPVKFKLRFLTHKYIHKKSLQEWLPSKIIHRKKRGFVTPIDGWLQSNLSNDVRDLLNSNNSLSRLIFKIDELNNLLKDHKEKKENYAKHIFILLSLELWYQNFFNNHWGKN